MDEERGGQLEGGRKGRRQNNPRADAPVAHEKYVLHPAGMSSLVHEQYFLHPAGTLLLWRGRVRSFILPKNLYKLT
jgi:hypothetical protein